VTPSPFESTRALLAAVLADPDPASHGSWLVAVGGPLAGERLALRDGAVLGRGRGADLRLLDGLASRSHARFTRVGSRWRVQDLGSKNGVRVNGRTTAPEGLALAPGDRLAVGDSVLLLEAPLPVDRALPDAPVPDPPACLLRRPSLVAAAALIAGAAGLAALAG